MPHRVLPVLSLLRPASLCFGIIRLSMRQNKSCPVGRLHIARRSGSHSGIIQAGRPPAQRADNRVLWETRAWRQGLGGRSPRSQRELSWDETVGRVCPSRSTLQLSPAPIRPARARTAPGAPIQQFGRWRTSPWSRTPFPGYSSLSALTGFTPAARRAGRYAAT